MGTQGLIFFIIIGLTCSTPLKSHKGKCTRPAIEMLDSTWTVYVNIINIKVYTCSVNIAKKRFKCEGGNPLQIGRYFGIEASVSYDDITNSCIDSARNLNNGTNLGDKVYPCERGISLVKRKTRNWSSDEAEADLESDKLFLTTGTICKYSLGFCYDPQDGFKGYVWEIKHSSSLSCNNLVPLNTTIVRHLRFTLDKEYIILEGEAEAFAVELVEQVETCGGKAWTNRKGLIITNDASFARGLQKRKQPVSRFLTLQKKQKLYESLLEACEKNRGNTEFFYFYAIVALLVYGGLHLLFSIYNHLINCMTFSKANTGMSTCLFQSWINRTLVNKSMVAETKLRSDTGMSRGLPKDDNRHSYYELEIP